MKKLSLLSLLLSSIFVYGDIVVFDNKDEFLSDLGATNPVLNFESYADGTTVTGTPIVEPNEWESWGVIFESNVANPIYKLPKATINYTPYSPTHCFGVYNGSQMADNTDYTFHFVKPVRAFSCVIIDSEYGSINEKIRVFDENDAILGEYPIPYYGSATSSPDANYFWGMKSTVPVKKIVFLEDDTDNESILFDDLIIANFCYYNIRADLNDDCKVNLLDLAIMSQSWLVDCDASPTNPVCDPK